jgi:hypothetical protein
MAYSLRPATMQMRHDRARRCLGVLAALGLWAVGCTQGESTLALLVIAPDGGNPFVGAEMATEARFRLEGDSAREQVVAVPAGGGFSLEVDAPTGSDPVRALLEARRGDTLVGWGATPPLRWNTLGPTFLPLFVQRRDTLVPAPWGLGAARQRPFLASLDGNFVVVLGGAAERGPMDVYDLAWLAPVSGAASTDDAFNRDASVLRLRDGSFLLVRGCVTAVWQPTDNSITTPMEPPPSGRCELAASTAVQDPDGGGLLLGGRTAQGPSTRVDRVTAEGVWMLASPLRVAREAPEALRIGPGEVLVAGGQTPPAPTLERYNESVPEDRRTLTTGDAAVDNRRGGTLVALRDGVALLLGGLGGDNTLATDDVLLDLGCVVGGCAPVLGRAALLSQRRHGATAARAEGHHVVVAGGTDAAGGVTDAVEVLDATDARRPMARGRVAALPYTGLSMLPLSTGAVLVAGGGRRETWFYRH